PGCTAGLPCPAGTTYVWSVAPATVGALSSDFGPTTELTAGTANVTGWVNVSGTLNGVVIAAASVTVSVETATPVLVGVSIAPVNPSITVGGVELFAATPSCSPAPCPSGAVVSWAVSGAVGTLSSTTGLSTTFTATTAGNGTVYANATLNGHSAHGSTAVSVTNPKPTGGTNSTPTPLYENPLLWIAVVVVLVVLVAAIVLMRRRPGAPAEPAATPSSGSSETPPDGE
ncbi:MAG TPA: hypothetical protein VGP88_04825, partial [Thermoplasmata archaeon]|nr:hypothetical protein [Thermoplasmata archaeon]